jgi:GNAT superfamily N-acetyltransferase
MGSTYRRQVTKGIKPCPDDLMPEQTRIVRDPTAADECAWRVLWSNYNAFYEAIISESVTVRTWQRILDPKSPIFCRLAVVNGHVAGLSISVLHEGTWTVAPICYLEDLFVQPNFRGRGLGRLLIQDLVDRAKSEGWSRLYWHTRSSNTARRLFDEFLFADDFVRYRLIFD